MQSLLFLIKLYYIPQTRLVSSVEIPPNVEIDRISLRFIRLDDHKLDIFGIF